MSLLNPGNDAFAQVGSVRWSPNGWELDRLTEPWQGSHANLAAFIAGLSMWQASATDGNMYLEDWTSNGDPVHPTVDLIFIGKKGGALPPARARDSQGIQEAQYVSFEYSEDDGLRISITYKAPSTNKVLWDNSPLVIDSIGAATPDDCEVLAFSAEAYGSYVPVIPTTLAEALAYFSQFTTSTGDNEEVVPGQYYRGTQTKQNSLISQGF